MDLNNINELNGEQFQKLMLEVKNHDARVYNLIIEQYFGEYANSDNPIIESWADDCDEVWDAEAALYRVCTNHPDSKLTKLVKNFELV